MFTWSLVVRDPSVSLQTPAVTFPALKGGACRWTPVLEGMNAFPANLDVTFRRDERNGRVRINKSVSRKDREQKAAGEYYDAPTVD
jgi:ATP-binding cassette subfamily E protein 1